MLLFWREKIVTAAKITTHILIERQLVVYRRERSAVWQCRFSVDGVWQRTSTHERDFTLAKQRAHDVLVEANVRKKNECGTHHTFLQRRGEERCAANAKRARAETGQGHLQRLHQHHSQISDSVLWQIQNRQHRLQAV